MSYNYRVFVDAYGNTHYYRNQTSSSTTLSTDISSTDIIIPVVDVLGKLFNNDQALLNRFNDMPLVPQVVWIGNERIEFFSVDLEIGNNSLVQCIRGTAGTSAVAHSNGDTVWDGSERQSLLAAAARTDTTFTVNDVNSFPWNSAIITYLSEA